MTHPGLTERGEPGATRYLCPECDWYLDVPPAPMPDVRQSGYVIYVTDQEKVEFVLRAHMTTLHPAWLSERGLLDD